MPSGRNRWNNFLITAQLAPAVNPSPETFTNTPMSQALLLFVAGFGFATSGCLQDPNCMDRQK